VTVTNPGRDLGFFVHLRITNGRGGEELLPVLWQDNHFSPLPGERREVTATDRTEDLEGTHPVIEVNGWDVAPGAQ
jgi:exo-1,4-beta-D-glucosaminidase